MPRYRAVLDACVLAPMPLADTLLRLAWRGMFIPCWSEDILAEVARTLEKFGYPAAPIHRRITVMTSVFEEAMVHDLDSSLLTHSLPDPDDNHVLVAAVQAGASAIVTLNLKDFPESICRGHGVDVLSPDRFLLNQFGQNPVGVGDVLREQTEAMRNPPVPLTELLDLLRSVAPDFVEQVGLYLNND